MTNFTGKPSHHRGLPRRSRSSLFQRWMRTGLSIPTRQSPEVPQNQSAKPRHQTYIVKWNPTSLLLRQYLRSILGDSHKAGILEMSCPLDHQAIKAERADEHKATHGRHLRDSEAAARRPESLILLETLSADERDNLALRVPFQICTRETIARNVNSRLLHSAWRKLAHQAQIMLAAKSVPSYALLSYTR